MKFYIDITGNYFEGDKQPGSIEVPQRPSPLHEWTGTVWTQNDEAIKSKVSSDASTLLEASDWALLPDVNLSNKQEWIDYRAALRAISENPTVDSVLPTKPEKVWQK